MTPLVKYDPPRSSTGIRRDRHRRLRCEPLEDRRMLSVFFVDDDAPTGGDGLEWSSAFDDLDTALYRAMAANDDADPANDVDAIWIAEGVYTPTGGWASGSGREAYFFLPDGVTLYGGFEGTETTLEDRNADPAVHETVLSGEIGMPNDTWDNLYTVVYCHGTVTAGLDGLTITGGYDVRQSHSSHPGDGNGAGIFSRGTLTVSNCTITGNTVDVGAGIWNSGTMRLIDSTVEGNTAVIEGGGIYNQGTLRIESSTISSNEAGSKGGGISNADGDLTVTGSTVSGNTIRGHYDSDSNYGAGIYNADGDLLVRDCRVVRNLIGAGAAGRGSYGGGIANRGNAEVTGTLVMANHVDGGSTNQGAGIWNSSSGSLTLANTTVTYNVYDYDIFGEITNDGELTLRNSIVYSDRYAELGGCGTIAASNNLIGVDPLFADPYADDFRLTEASPALNIG